MRRVRWRNVEGARGELVLAGSLERLSHSIEADVLAGWQDFVVYLLRKNPAREIAARIGVTPDLIVGLPEAAERFAAIIVGAAWDAGIAEAKYISAETKALFTFDVHDASVVSWAKAAQADTARALIDEQREMIAQIVNRVAYRNTPAARLMKAAGDPFSPDLDAVAREMRASIGLTPSQESFIANYRRELEEGRYADARRRELHGARFNRTLDAAERTGRPLTRTQINAMVENYRANWRAFRAQTITLTESMRTMHEGVFMMYQQAIAAGRIDHNRIVRQWVSAKDHRVRHSHRALNKQRVLGLHPFLSPSGALLRFPGDPQAPMKETIRCRCAVSVRLLPS